MYNLLIFNEVKLQSVTTVALIFQPYSLKNAQRYRQKDTLYPA